jgi:hypothetical protein
MNTAIAINKKDKDLLGSKFKTIKTMSTLFPFGVPVYYSDKVPIGEYWIGPEEKIKEKIK